jgi:hypothetical protein
MEQKSIVEAKMASGWFCFSRASTIKYREKSEKTIKGKSDIMLVAIRRLIGENSRRRAAVAGKTLSFLLRRKKIIPHAR